MDGRLNIVMFNQDWLRPELEALGHQVTTVGLKGRDFDLVVPQPGVYLSDILDQLPNKPDRLIYHDESAPPWIFGLEKSELPSIFYSVDTHHHYLWHRFFAELFDTALLAQVDYLPMFQESHPNVRWFPLWISRYREPCSEKSIEVSFRGSMSQELHPQRAKFFSSLKERVDIDAREGDFTTAYSQSKIVVNQNVRADLNFRVFEALGCGAMLITPAHAAGLSQLFQDRVELVTYEGNNPEDAAEKIKYYLKNEAEREAIAARGYRIAHERHSAGVRAKELERELYSCQLLPKPNRYLAAARSSLVSYSANRHCGVAWEFDLLGEANQLLLQSAACEGHKEDVISAALLLKCYLDEVGRLTEGAALIESFVEIFPEEDTLKIFRLGDLVSSGEAERSHSYATSFTDQPDELLASLPALLQSCRDKILNGDAVL